MSKVAVLKTRPDSVVADYQRVCELADYKSYLPKDKETILKLNLSWSLFFPACSTTPWQLEGVLNALFEGGYRNIIPVENRTVVTDPVKGARLNKWDKVLKKYGLEFIPLTRVDWIPYEPRGKQLALHEIFHDTNHIPEMFRGKNIVHLPTQKCVHPDTEIFLSDGTLLRIGDVVDGILNKNRFKVTDDGDFVAESNRSVISLNDDGLLSRNISNKFWKTPSQENLIEVRLKTGKTVKVSKQHPFLTSRGWIKAKNLNVEDRVAIPSRVEIKGCSQSLPKIKTLNHSEIDVKEINFRRGHKYSITDQRYIVEEYIKGTSTTQLAEEFNTHCESMRSILIRYGVDIRWTKKWSKAPARTSTDFCRWLGYFIADGYTQQSSGTTRFWWTNKNNLVRADYLVLTKKLFGVEPKKRRNDIYFDSKHLKYFFEEIGFVHPVNAGNKNIPPLLFKCPESEVAGFIKAYYEGDGNVSGNEVRITTKSEKLADRLLLLLLRLGVVGFKAVGYSAAYNTKKKVKRKYFTVSIYGDYTVRFSKHINFLSEIKNDALKKLVERRRNNKKPTNWDTIPVNSSVFRRVREGLGFSQESTGKPSSVNGIENNHLLPTRDTLNYFIKSFEESDRGLFKDEINYMKFLSSSDIAWDHIAEIHEIKSDTKHLYDLSVSETNNFIGNGIILHNTHGHTTITGAMKNAFGGLITSRRHHCHKKIHEVLVDLLMIQKEVHTGIFAVTDGTVAGDGAGPRAMHPHVKDYILASGDQVAIDAVSAKMMGFEPLDIPFIRIAHERGLGVGDFDQIDVVGEDVSDVNYNFKTKKSLIVWADQLFRKGALSMLEPLIFHTPLFHFCIWGSALFHDYVWYPTEGRKRINEFMKTQWGQLFKQY